MIEHSAFHELSLLATPEETGVTLSIQLKPRMGTRFQLAAEEFIVKGCDEASWTRASFNRLRGGGSSIDRPPLTSIEGSLINFREQMVPAQYVIVAELPRRFPCFQVELPPLIVNNERQVLGRIEYQLGELRFWHQGY